MQKCICGMLAKRREKRFELIKCRMLSSLNRWRVFLRPLNMYVHSCTFMTSFKKTIYRSISNSIYNDPSTHSEAVSLLCPKHTLDQCCATDVGAVRTSFSR